MEERYEPGPFFGNLARTDEDRAILRDCIRCYATMSLADEGYLRCSCCGRQAKELSPEVAREHFRRAEARARLELVHFGIADEVGNPLEASDLKERLAAARGDLQ